MHDRPEDIIARREQAEAADAIMRAERQRREQTLIGGMLDAFAAAHGEPDARAAQVLRERFKTALICVEGLVGGMTPGAERSWVVAFVQLGRVFADVTNTAADRQAASWHCVNIAGRLRLGRGGV